MVETTLPTRVGRAERGDNRFRGASVANELAGKTSLATMLALSLGHPLEETESRMLDDLASCCLAADPRIWPLKIVRVATSHGNLATGLCAAFLGGRGRFGPAIVGAAAELLSEIAAEVASGSTVRDAVERRTQDVDARLPGYGVVQREIDERAVALGHCVATRGRERLSMWRLAQEIDACTQALRHTRINIAGALAAALLDLGFGPRDIPAMMYALLLPNWLANAAEGAEQAPEVLQRLPAEAVRYVGPPPRESPRAAAQGASLRLLRLGEG